MKLKLTRPLVFFDLETTGVNVSRDRIIEFSYIKVYPDGHEESGVYRMNPGVPIPPESTAVHHITDADVAGEPSFAELAQDLVDIFRDSDIAGFNSNKFDVPLLVEEFSRIGKRFDLVGRKFVDVQTIYHKMEPRTLTAAYRYYCGGDLENAHSAQADTRATYEVLLAQLEKYPETPEFGGDIERLSVFSRQNNNIDLSGRFSRNDKGQAVFNFGKFKGQSVIAVLRKEPQYYDWMMQGDFPKDTKDVLTQLRAEAMAKK